MVSKYILVCGDRDNGLAVEGAGLGPNVCFAEPRCRFRQNQRNITKPRPNGSDMTRTCYRRL
jgi:hypothetical protein